MTARSFDNLTPNCHRCGHPILGPRVIGHARLLDHADRWVCGHCSTTTEERAWLRHKLIAETERPTGHRARR